MLTGIDDSTDKYDSHPCAAERYMFSYLTMNLNPGWRILTCIIIQFIHLFPFWNG